MAMLMPFVSAIYCDEYNNAWFAKWGPNSTVAVGGSEEVNSVLFSFV